MRLAEEFVLRRAFLTSVYLGCGVMEVFTFSPSPITTQSLRGEGEDEGFCEDTTLTPSLSRKRERVTTDCCVEAVLQQF